MTRILVILSIVITAFQAQARDRFVLNIDDHFQGQNTIFLKQEIQQQYPRANVRNLELVAVRLVAKSKHGRGQATLSVGQEESYPQTIAGNRDDFHVNRPYTWDRVRIENPSYFSRGRWQIHLRGNIKVKRVVVIARGGNGGSLPDRSTLRCESRGHRYNTCSVAGRIVSARVAIQHSNSSCIEGYSWGYEGDYIWVDQGCRATFSVDTSGGRRRGRHL